DHILFVLGLFLFSARLKPLLWQVSAFTLAHSITLGLALYGVVRLPSSITEPLIAASIVFVAVENIFAKNQQPWRYAVVFCFGLIHGLGFASAFANAGLPRQDFLIGLVGFNLGVECGQLAVIISAFLAVGWFRHRRWHRRVIVVPASSVIALIALFWTVQRIFWPSP
ncbi:MAG TPA: HupE/UreJ family protein, partial [Candidatus Binatia bacterium]|nr:HupE/UreJ family protein [Candidatus Binatia bacterium]